MKNKTLNYLHTKACFILHVMVRYFGFKIKVDNKLVRRSMDGYFYYHEWNYSTQITKIEVFETKKGLEILIETHNPGLLVGKAGHFIDGMAERLKEDLKRNDIKINLKECKLWMHLY
jgi:ribosomal protein S3